MNGELSITGRGQSARHMMAQDAMDEKERSAHLLLGLLNKTNLEIRIHGYLHTFWAICALASSTLFMRIEPLPVFIIMAGFLTLRHFAHESLVAKREASEWVQSSIHRQIDDYNQINEWIEAVSALN